MQTARGAKKSALHDRLADAGAYFRDVSGWEGADWFAPEGVEPVVEELVMGTPELVPLLGSRALRRAQRRHRHGHVLHGQVQGAGT